MPLKLIFRIPFDLLMVFCHTLMLGRSSGTPGRPDAGKQYCFSILEIDSPARSRADQVQLRSVALLVQDEEPDAEGIEGCQPALWPAVLSGVRLLW